MTEVRSKSTWLGSLWLSLAIVLTAVLSGIATISHATADSVRPVVLAAGATLLGIVPPLFIGRLLSNGAARQLLVVAWRLAIMLPAIAIGFKLSPAERNCYMFTLVACYFVSLPLESWLLIRDVRQHPQR